MRSAYSKSLNLYSDIDIVARERESPLPSFSVFLQLFHSPLHGLPPPTRAAQASFGGRNPFEVLKVAGHQIRFLGAGHAVSRNPRIEAVVTIDFLWGHLLNDLDGFWDRCKGSWGGRLIPR